MVKLGDVRTFPGVEPDKAQVLKIAEEEHEVYSAWEYAEAVGVEYADPDIANPNGECYERECLLNECADLIQATCNLLAAIGIEDFTPYMEACEERNRERGRL